LGIRCSCGVLVNAFNGNRTVLFGRDMETGALTYLADVCADTLETSTLSLTFVNTDGGTNTSFTFEVGPLIAGTEITSVECNGTGEGNCVIIVTGTGLKQGFLGSALLNFTAIFRDQATDSVQSFIINGFFDQNGIVPVVLGSITAQGCS
jgi:hypothetical protein